MVKITLTPITSSDGDINLENWLQHISQRYHLKNLSLLRQAGVLAQLAGAERAAPNGESCFHQGLSMAEILAELNLDEETLAAAIVYSSVRYGDLNLDDVTEHLGAKVTKLVTGTKQMEAINVLSEQHPDHSHDATTIDNIRKMLLAMVDDIGVVLIKLAERLCFLRNLTIYNETKKRALAKETMDIYAPLANRLGIGQLKWQLEDLSFRYLAPDEYKQISTALKLRRIERDQYIRDFIASLYELLKPYQIANLKISGRSKHIYSIYRKMQRKRVSFDEIYDVTAVRVLVDSIADCYTVLSHVHTQWQHIPKEFDDYIATPKPNGYQSIHTVVYGPTHRAVEIQIRTNEMHEKAELGVAAHWLYKEGKHKLTSYEEKIAWLRQVLDWQKEVAQDNTIKQEIQTQLFDDRAYVFTPNGAVLDLPKGATPLDFAYHIHSELGNRCRGAKVNSHIVPLTYQLNTGDRVEILTVKSGQPSRDWINPHLNYLKTARAKAKVMQWFRKQDIEKNIAAGQLELEKELKRLGLKNIDIENTANKLHYKTKEDMLAALGRGDLRINAILQIIQPPSELPVSNEISIKIETPRTKSSEVATDFDIHGVGNLLTHIARCCKPIPGDPITGYITQGRGISIHRKDCPNILSSSERHQEKLIAVNWGSKILDTYPVDLVINAYERQGLIRDITSLLANENISLLGINSTTNKATNITHISLTIEVNSLAPLSKILAHLNQVPNVYEVKRVS